MFKSFARENSGVDRRSCRRGEKIIWQEFWTVLRYRTRRLLPCAYGNQFWAQQSLFVLLWTRRRTRRYSKRSSRLRYLGSHSPAMRLALGGTHHPPPVTSNSRSRSILPNFSQNRNIRSVSPEYCYSFHKCQVYIHVRKQKRTAYERR